MAPAFPRHILFQTPEFPPMVGGIGRYSVELARSLHALGQTITVIAPRCEGMESIDANLPYPVIRWNEEYPGVPLLREALDAWKLRKTVRRLGADVILCSNWMPCGLSARWSRSIPYTVISYSAELGRSDQRPDRPFLQKLKQKTVRKALMNFAISSYPKTILENLGVDSNRISLLPPGYTQGSVPSAETVERFRKLKGWEGRRILLTVARLAPHKGQDRVIEALPRVLREIPDLLYAIVGIGPGQEEIQKLVDKHGLQGSVFFAGAVSEEDLSLYYAAANTFILTSRETIVGGRRYIEGFGIVFLEAYHHGLPVIGGRSGGIPDAVLDGETGLLVDPNSPEDIARAILHLFHDDDLRQRLIRGGTRKLADHNWDRIAAICLNTLAERLSGNQKT